MISRLRPALARTAIPSLALVTAGTLAACGGGAAEAGDEPQTGTVSVTHAQGTSEVPKAPAKVVVLDLAVLDTLDVLGVGSSVVGLPKDSLTDFQSAYAGDEIAPVGTMQEPDVEKIAALEPDAILIGGRSAESYPELTKIAPTVDLTIAGSDFLAGAKAQSESIGKIFGKESEVAAKLAALETSVETVKGKAANSGKTLVLMTSGGKVSAFGAGSRFGLIHEGLGVPQAVEGLKQDRHGQAVSFEFIAKTNPDRLLVIDRDAAIGERGAAAQQVLDNPLVSGTAAWQNGKVTYLDGQRWYLLGGGLGNLGAMVDAVGAAVSS